MTSRERREADCWRKLAALRILADLDDWRATRRMREAVESLELCQALWQIPAHQPRKEEDR
ncbi:hypothetical protein ACFVZH_20670 [Streptomyces sp. NPDC059534]|uniref:hypothetical protein n=1 Tax=Streptomyces sp. NPDC059534 TaxID=3346859 RepID=UPI0036D0C379